MCGTLPAERISVMHPVGAGRLVRFGPFELNPQTGELRKCGVRVRLPEQSAKGLVALLQRPSELVTREELRQRLWTADTFVDFEHGLNLAVARLRQALGDTAEPPRYVETLPRKGYRFSAKIESLKDEPLPSGASINGHAPDPTSTAGPELPTPSRVWPLRGAVLS